MRLYFEEMSMFAQKSGRCGCGKKRVRQKTFFQTLNPFNRNAHGMPKTREEIEAELRAEIAEWKQKPITCDKCTEARKREVLAE